MAGPSVAYDIAHPASELQEKIMLRPALFGFYPLVCTVLLAGCGGEIARIDGLPQTRDVSSVDWPRLVDTPKPPTDRLLPQTGTQTLAALSDTRTAVLARAAEPGAPSLSIPALTERSARIQQVAASPAPGVDQAELSARAARLAALRAETEALTSAAVLDPRSARLATARSALPDDIDAADLKARAARIAAQTQRTPDNVDREDLTQRAKRLAALVSEEGPMPEPLRAQRIPKTADAPPSPAPKPRRPDLSEPVLTDDFRKRAAEALKRARERAVEQ